MAKSSDVQTSPQQKQPARPQSLREPASEIERRKRNERAQELRQKNRARSMRRR